MDNLKELFDRSGLTLNELSKMSGISLSTTHRYIHNKTKGKDNEYYSSIYEILKKYNEQRYSQMLIQEGQSAQGDEFSHININYLIVKAERDMYKAFYDQIVEMYKDYVEKSNKGKC